MSRRSAARRIAARRRADVGFRGLSGKRGPRQARPSRDRRRCAHRGVRLCAPRFRAPARRRGRGQYGDRDPRPSRPHRARLLVGAVVGGPYRRSRPGAAAALFPLAHGRARHRLRAFLHDARPEPRLSAGRGGAAGELPRAQHALRRDVRRRRRPDAAGRGDPDLYAARGDRGARVRRDGTRPQGGDDRHRAARAGPDGDRQGPVPVAHAVDALDRDGLALRLRSVLAEMHRAQGDPGLPHLLARHRLSRLAEQLRLQPSRRLRRRCRVLLPLPALQRRHQALPRAELRLPRGWGGLGGQPPQRHRRALGEAQRQGDGEEPRSGPLGRRLARAALPRVRQPAAQRPSASAPTRTATS